MRARRPRRALVLALGALGLVAWFVSRSSSWRDELGDSRVAQSRELDALRPGEIRDVELFLDPWITVRGIVTDGGGVPIEHATVTAVPGEGHLGGGGVESGADGRFTLPRFEPGSVQVLAGASGRFCAQQTLSGDVDEELHLVLGPPATVRGRVLEPDGTPCEGAGVYSLEQPQPRSLHREWDSMVYTDRDGVFVLPLTWPATRVVALQRGFAESIPLPLEIGAGTTTEDVTLRLRRGCPLSVLVLDENGVPVQAMIWFRFESSYERSEGTDPYGVYEAHDLPPGAASIEATSSMSTRPSGQSSVDVALDPSYAPRVTLRLPPRKS